MQCTGALVRKVREGGAEAADRYGLLCANISDGGFIIVLLCANISDGAFIIIQQANYKIVCCCVQILVMVPSS